ncbi:MAG: hypothetical protein KAU17_02855 [Spirochaetales bacterium]|nr:hypothetical protein [Spirochaetales bacterium]
MKKIVLIALVFLILSVVSVSALGIGAAYSLNFLESGTDGAAVSLKLDGLPLLGIRFSIGTPTSIGLTADWWMYQKPLAGMLGLYAGPGGYVNVAIPDGGDSTVDLGLRVPVGLQIFPLDFLELFIEVAPSIGIIIADPVTFPDFGLQGAFGFRFWF